MVGSFVQLLELRYKDKLDSEAGEFIAYAVEGATRMQKLINDLLAISRVGGSNREMQPMDAGAALQMALGSLKGAIEESGVVVTHNQLPTVVANSTELVRLFEHLVDNAIKFRREEPPRVHVGAERMGDECLFSVRDNGIGIDPAHFERIFRLFQRLNMREKYPGTGIGLAECKKIVERHGGRIWVESEPGKGTIFYFTLARERRKVEQLPPHSAGEVSA